MSTYEIAMLVHGSIDEINQSQADVNGAITQRELDKLSFWISKQGMWLDMSEAHDMLNILADEFELKINQEDMKNIKY